jgi:hypothetical protein
LAIADAIGGSWPARARDAALASAGEVSEDDPGAMLLQDIRTIFDDANADVLAGETIVSKLIAIEDRPWSEWSHGRPLTKTKLNRILAKYDIQSAGVVRIGTKTPRGYRRAAFVDAWDRYLGVPKVQQRNNSNKNGPELATSNCNSEDGCCTSESENAPINIGPSCTVALSGGETGQNLPSEDSKGDSPWDA